MIWSALTCQRFESGDPDLSGPHIGNEEWLLAMAGANYYNGEL